MYDRTANCVYDTTETYQAELLRIFGITDYDVLVVNIQALYDSLEKTNELNTIVKKIQSTAPWATTELAFFLLFSYEYFSYMHAYLKDANNYNSLCSIFE